MAGQATESTEKEGAAAAVATPEGSEEELSDQEAYNSLWDETDEPEIDENDIKSTATPEPEVISEANKVKAAAAQAGDADAAKKEEKAEEVATESAEAKGAETAAEEKKEGDQDPESMTPAQRVAKQLADDKAAHEQESQAAERYWQEVTKAVPDAGTIADSDQFQAWLASQPDDVRAKASADASPAEAVSVLSAYKVAAANGTASEAKSVEIPDYEALMKDSAVADAEVETVDAQGNRKTVKISELASDYPDVLGASYHMAKAMISHMGGGRQTAEMKAMQKEISDLRAVLGDMRLNASQAGGDIKALQDDPAFKEFYDSRPAPVKQLWDNGDSESRLAFIDLFNEVSGATSAAPAESEAKTKAKAASKRTKAVHSGTMGGSNANTPASASSGGGGSTENDEAEFHDAWDEIEDKDV